MASNSLTTSNETSPLTVGDLPWAGAACAHTGAAVAVGCQYARSCPFGNHDPNPIDQRHSWLPQWLLQIAEFEMCVCIDKPGQQSDGAEIDYLVGFCFATDASYRRALDIDNTELDRRSFYRKYNSCFEREPHDAIVAEFTRIRPRQSRI